MQGIQRRIVYITLYEGIAIVAASAGLALMTDAGLGHSGVLAVAASVIAVIWNLVFNALFERWESRQAVRGRSVRRRVAHAIGLRGRADRLPGADVRLGPGRVAVAGAGDGPGAGGVLPGLHLRLQLGLRSRVRPADLGDG